MITINNNGLTTNSTSCLMSIPGFDNGSECFGKLLKGQYFTGISDWSIDTEIEGDSEKSSFGYYYNTPSRGQTVLTINGYIVAYDTCSMFNAMRAVSNVYPLNGDCNGFNRIDIQCGDSCVANDTLAVSQADNSSVFLASGSVVQIKFNDYYSSSVASVYYLVNGVYNYYNDINTNISGVLSIPNNDGIRIDFGTSSTGNILADVFVYDCVPSRNIYAYGQVIQKPVFSEDGSLVKKYEVKIRIKDYFYNTDTVYINNLKEQDAEGVYCNPSIDDCCDSNGCVDNTPICCGGTSIFVESCSDVCVPICATIKWSGEPAINNSIIGQGIYFGNLSTGEGLQFKSDFILKKDDVIKICSANEKVLLNGVEADILEVGSIYPYLCGGENRLILRDATSVGLYGALMSYDISYNTVV